MFYKGKKQKRVFSQIFFFYMKHTCITIYGMSLLSMTINVISTYFPLKHSNPKPTQMTQLVQVKNVTYIVQSTIQAWHVSQSFPLEFLFVTRMKSLKPVKKSVWLTYLYTGGVSLHLFLSDESKVLPTIISVIHVVTNI